MYPFELNIDNLVKNSHFNQVNNQVDISDFDDFSIERSDGKLILTTTGEPNNDLHKEFPTRKDGGIKTVDLKKDIITFSTTASNVSMILRGVSTPSSINVSFEKVKSIQTTKLSISAIDYKVKGSATDDFIIEYLDNADFNHFFGNSSFDLNVHETIKYKLGKFEFPVKNERFSSSFATMVTIEDVDIYCYQETKSIGKGFIVYSKKIDEEKRNKIRECLSFILGRELIYLGYGIFDRQTNPVFYKLYSIYKGNITYLKSITLPPVILSHISADGKVATNNIASGILSNLIIRLYNSYDALDLNHIFKLYWYAIYADSSISPVHWGALIEAFAREIEQSNEVRILDDNIFKSLQKEMVSVLNNYKIDQESLELLKNKISWLNSPPKKEEFLKLFEMLELDISELEIKSWNQRNGTAHGKKIKNISKQQERIKQARVLNILFHRLFLGYFDKNSYYIDYSSKGFPIRNVRECIREK